MYVGILAWRYGSTAKADGCPEPDFPGTSLTTTSITEYEYRQAVTKNKRVLMFLLDPEAAWPSSRMDALSPGGGAAIAKLRDEVSQSHLVSYYHSPEDLASLVGAALYRAEMDRHMELESLHFDARFDQPLVRSSQNLVEDNTLMEITAVIGGPEELQALQVRVGVGREWWMTQLYFLASLARDLTAIHVIVFIGHEDRFIGIADPRIVLEKLGSLTLASGRYERALAKDRTAVANIAGEIARRARVWAATLVDEQTGADFVTRRDLRRGLGRT